MVAEHAIRLVKNPTRFHLAQVQAVGLAGQPPRLPRTARVTLFDVAYYTMFSLILLDSHNNSDYYFSFAHFAHAKARAKNGGLLVLREHR